MNTPDKATQIKGAITALLAFLTALWGWVGWAIIIWVACILLDYISGSAAARRNGEWSSEVARDGLWHKLGEIFAVLVAALCDIALGVVLKSAPFALPFEFTTLLTPIVLLWYIITELGSILENAGKLGAPLPKWLKKMLKQYKDTIDAAQGDEHPPDDNE
ncbi:MAG: phage holin family protein [Mogibacterium sp.]|nr:phage holin family protein [Mogibacterium sp.]